MTDRRCETCDAWVRDAPDSESGTCHGTFPLPVIRCCHAVPLGGPPPEHQRWAQTFAHERCKEWAPKPQPRKEG